MARRATPKKPRRDESSPDDQISFVLDLEDETRPETEQDASAGNAQVTKLEKPYIRTSSKATILHLKKFLTKKLNLEKPEDVDIMCRGEVLGKEFELEYVSKTRWRMPEQLVLKFRPKVDFSTGTNFAE